MDNVQRALRDLTLASPQIEDEEQRRKLRRDAQRAIDKQVSISFLPTEDGFEVFHQNLRRTLGIKVTEKFLQEKPMYTSPRDFVKIFHKNVTPKTVRQLFENQHKIEWHTKTGGPDQFSFYGFCKDVVNAGGKDVMTYQTRKAHVISRLYHAKDKLDEIRDWTHWELCPPVYMRTLVGGKLTWKKWIYNSEENIFEETDQSANINWITNLRLRRYIANHSEHDNDGSDLLNADQHLYWAVLEEDDFEENQPHVAAGGNLVKTQIYVGQAKNGIKDRWTGVHGSSHCMKMKQSRNAVCEMVNYDPNALNEYQLVDLRFLLHMAYNQEGENSGLFIMQCTDDKLDETEKKHIAGIKLRPTFTLHPKDMNYGMNCRS